MAYDLPQLFNKFQHAFLDFAFLSLDLVKALLDDSNLKDSIDAAAFSSRQYGLCATIGAILFQ